MVDGPQGLRQQRPPGRLGDRGDLTLVRFHGRCVEACEAGGMPADEAPPGEGVGLGPETARLHVREPVRRASGYGKRPGEGVPEPFAKERAVTRARED